MDNGEFSDICQVISFVNQDADLSSNMSRKN